MKHLIPAQIGQFLKQFPLKGGYLRRFRVTHRSLKESSGELILSVVDADSSRRVRLRIVLEEVEEFRFQRRPGPSLVRIKEARLGVFNGVFYLNLDAYTDDAPPALHDYRASDAFIAARSLAWEIVPSKNPAAE